MPGLFVAGYMDGDDVALRHQILQRKIADAHGLRLRPAAAGIGDHIGPKGQKQLGRAQTDGAGADDAHGLAADLPAAKPGGGAAGADGALAVRQPAQTAKGQADHLLRHADGGIARRVADGHALLPAGVQRHMVHAGKGHIQQLQGLGLFHHLRGIGRVGKDGDIAVAGAAGQLRRVGIPGVKGNKGVALGLQPGGIACQNGRGDAQRLQKRDLHRAFLLCEKNNGSDDRFPRPVQPKTATAPRLTASTMAPAAATPSRIISMACFRSTPSSEATSAPVQAPVPGRGMATRINRPRSLYL